MMQNIFLTHLILGLCALYVLYNENIYTYTLPYWLSITLTVLVLSVPVHSLIFIWIQ